MILGPGIFDRPETNICNCQTVAQGGSACNDKGWRCRCLTSNGSSCITITSYKISLADEKDAFQLNEIEDRSKV